MAEHANHPWAKRWHRVMALLMIINLLVVGFNLSYPSLRMIYLRYAPAVVRVYDPVLGIEPQPMTQTYLQTVDQLKRVVAQAGSGSASAQALFADLRQQSYRLINENPYLVAGQMPIFATLKRRMRGWADTTSAQQAFDQLWQPQSSWEPSIQFFDQKIRPLLARNYYRATAETGLYVDEFWRIDLIFVLIFGGEFLGRTYLISRRREAIGWGDAIARGWYDLPLILPFWRWLRLLPTAVRIHRAQWLNVERLIGQVTHEPAAYLSDRVSKFVLVRLVNQTQASVKAGTLLADWKSSPQQPSAPPSRLGRLSDRLLQLVVYRVLPEIQPDLENLLRHSLQGALSSNDFYGDLKQVPGFEGMPESAIEVLSTYLAEATCDVLAESYADEEGRILMDQLSQDFRAALGREIRDHQNSVEIKQLLDGLLEELKYAYLQRAKDEDPESTLEEADQLQQDAAQLP
ncbi:hypothetical protein C7271_12795 [filamentous cyanobacterium CCP5]|nr:hypothetical protein C7271_12795 [filamentous cyanobacterium CCP5]